MCIGSTMHHRNVLSVKRPARENLAARFDVQCVLCGQPTAAARVKVGACAALSLGRNNNDINTPLPDGASQRRRPWAV